MVEGNPIQLTGSLRWWACYEHFPLDFAGPRRGMLGAAERDVWAGTDWCWNGIFAHARDFVEWLLQKAQ